MNIVIVGGTSGLGRALAECFVAAGHRVALSGRDRGRAQAVAAQIGARAIGFGCDVRDSVAVGRLWLDAIEALGSIDHWLQNAGVGMARGTILQVAPSAVAECIETNLTGAFTGARVAARGLAAQGGGWIWLTEGLGSSGPVLPGSAPYGAGKAGATYAFTVLVKECRGTPVKVGFLRPTLMPTSLVVPSNDKSEAKALRLAMRYLGETPEAAARWFVPRIAGATRSGTRLSRVTMSKLARRALVGLVKSQPR